MSKDARRRKLRGWKSFILIIRHKLMKNMRKMTIEDDDKSDDSATHGQMMHGRIGKKEQHELVVSVSNNVTLSGEESSGQKNERCLVGKADTRTVERIVVR
jgi:hypothetical protein